MDLAIKLSKIFILFCSEISYFIDEDADFGIYIVLLTPKGKGKSALLSSFKDSKFVVCLENFYI